METSVEHDKAENEEEKVELSILELEQSKKKVKEAITPP